jgi:hypothetical protein
MEISDKLTKLLCSKKRKSSEDFEKTDSKKLDQFLATSCRQFFSSKVEFHRVEATDSHLSYLKSCYKPLNQLPPISKVTMEGDSSTGSSDVSQTNSGGSLANAEDIPKPKRDLYDSKKVEMEWKSVHGVGSGLTNLGNTCFLNSVLQCLLYTPPLHNYLTSPDHKKICKGGGERKEVERERERGGGMEGGFSQRGGERGGGMEGGFSQRRERERERERDLLGCLSHCVTPYCL